jgi:phenylalanyl-tRNA synthetase alpha chain
MLEKIKLLQAEASHSQPHSLTELENFRLKFMSKKGALKQLFADFNQLDEAEKRSVGPQLNALKNEIQAQYELHKQSLSASSTSTTATQEDYTLPPPADGLGSRHPLSLLKHKILELFEKIGFCMVEGNEIVDDWHNFGALNFEPNHPARDMQDTFFITQSPDMLLRTHTSSVQIHVAASNPLPIRTVSIGRTYRNETISARSHCMFHQVEGFYINTEVSFADLKQVLAYFIQNLFGHQVQVRLRPSYFPFTEPSTEIDITCTVCAGTGCPICKHSQWLEIGGGGMIDPQVLQNCGIDTDRYTGYAFGIGLERLAMLLHQINDLRLFTENDVRFLKQFKAYH